MGAYIVNIDDVPLSCPDPAATNPLYSTGFNLRINKFPELSFWCKNVTLPSISLPIASQESMHMIINHVGSKPEIGSLDIEFTIDENMDNYAAIMDWILLISTAESAADIMTFRKKFNDTLRPHDHDYRELTSDASLIVYGAGQKPIRAITFRDMWPSQVGGFQIVEDNTESNTITASASFQFIGKPILSKRINADT